MLMGGAATAFGVIPVIGFSAREFGLDADFFGKLYKHFAYSYSIKNGGPGQGSNLHNGLSLTRCFSLSYPTIKSLFPPLVG